MSNHRPYRVVDIDGTVHRYGSIVSAVKRASANYASAWNQDYPWLITYIDGNPFSSRTYDVDDRGITATVTNSMREINVENYPGPMIRLRVFYGDDAVKRAIAKAQHTRANLEKMGLNA